MTLADAYGLVVEQTTTQGMGQPQQLDASDSAKLLKNLSDIWTKTKENYTILQKKGMGLPNQALERQVNVYAQTIHSILNVTKGIQDPSVMSTISSGLNKELKSIIFPKNPAAANK